MSVDTGCAEDTSMGQLQELVREIEHLRADLNNSILRVAFVEKNIAETHDRVFGMKQGSDEGVGVSPQYRTTGYCPYCGNKEAK